ncbi:MAG: bifunctional demethylmenaquinone methyltransferase/2-methoxy-6-polyprenyl-1,4-benzoquinol methylase UbiE [Pseudomonadota bacterium]
MSASPEKTVPFGQENIPLHEKQGRVDGVFHAVAPKYDLMNDLMSAGLHRAWRNLMIAAASVPKNNRTFHHLDVAGGTGDIVFRLQKRAGTNVKSTLLDINASMLDVARQELATKDFADRVEIIEGNAEALPFEDKSHDLYTIAFGIRNVPDIQKALSEARRVLKIGGHFLCLELSQTDVPILEGGYRFYSDTLLPKIGEWVTGDGSPYAYLKDSIRRFPSKDNFAAMLREAGFEKVSYESLAGGICALHSAWRI